MRRLAAVLIAGLVLAPAASAASKGPVFGLRASGNPKLGYFVYTLARGGERTGSVIVSNVGNAAGTVKLFTSDGTTGPTSGTVYQTDEEPRKAGAWVSLAETSLTLAPGAHRTVPFTVHVPKTARPGQWVAGIVAETSHKVAEQKPGQKTRVQIKIRDLTIVAVQVNVPGKPVIAVTVGKVTTGGSRGFQKLIVHFRNAGNLLVKPHGTVDIYNAKTGKLVESLPFAMDSFLPDTAIDYPILLKKALPAGDYRAVVRMTIPGVSGASTVRVTARPTFSVSNADVTEVFSSSQPTQAPPGGTVASSSSGRIPVWGYAVAAALAALLLLLVALLLRRRRAAVAAAPQETFERRTDAVTAPPPPPPAPAPASAPAEPAPTPAAPPPAPAAAAACDHDWEVAYDRGTLGDDGVWRFPHRCRSCGVELLARDVVDASGKARRRL